jgi:Mrp family chromosome partitioning ATPase
VLSEYLGVPQTSGLAEWLLGSQEPISVQRVARSRFFLLPAGLGSGHFEEGAFVDPDEVDGMRVLIEEARRSFDFVIVDCPPLLPVADAMVLQRMVDGFVVVVRERHAPIESILYALDRVDAERLRGVVLNDHLEVLRRYERYQQGYYRKTG